MKRTNAQLLGDNRGLKAELESLRAELKQTRESFLAEHQECVRIFGELDATRDTVKELRTRVQELEETVTTLRGLYSGLREAVADGITDGCMCQVQHGGYYTVRCKPHEILAELDKLERGP